MQIVHDGEHPSPNVAAAPEQMELAPGPFDAVLHQVVGTGRVPGERPRIAPQTRDLLDDQDILFLHDPILPAPTRSAKTNKLQGFDRPTLSYWSNYTPFYLGERPERPVYSVVRSPTAPWGPSSKGTELVNAELGRGRGARQRS